MKSPILVGAVIYDPKVALIWDIIKEFFAAERCPIDYVFYSNYELMVEALIGRHIDIAWNSPLAWVDAVRRTDGKVKAIAMRDTDRDRVSHVIVKKGTVKSVADLRGKRVATGAKDSPQATLLPLHMLHGSGLEPGRDVEVKRFDLLVGKHGDHIGGEKEALKCLLSGGADACAMLDLNWASWTKDGTADSSRLEILATTPPFDHCNFTVLDSFDAGTIDRWSKTLFHMTYDNPAHREMMDMEGLKAWLPGRTSGYTALTEATKQQRFFEAR
jgi:ABC-type phosphate/phosphonate transport system substrate-binding protein